MSCTKHGMSKKQIYKIWTTMIARCYRKTHVQYRLYGGRGIKVSNEWRDFVNFFNDMGHKPDGKSLERIDNNKGYSKENCRWATPKEQSRNRGDNILITYKGKTMILTDWANELEVNHSTMYYRIMVYKMPLEKALQKKIRK